MAGPAPKKRSNGSGALPEPRPTKKQRKLAAYHSSSSEEELEEPDFQGFNLDDSGEEDAGTGQEGSGSASASPGSASEQEDARQSQRVSPARSRTKKGPTTDAAGYPDSEADDDGSNASSDTDSDPYPDPDNDNDADPAAPRRAKSKRNDPAAFATSLSKILGTKLSTTRRVDPVFARSQTAQELSRATADAALESKARRQLREQKRRALEKGRVKDVLVATTTTTTTRQPVALVGDDAAIEQEAATEVGMSASEVLAAERRLRKVAQRGVVKLFNAVRAAQVRASEAAREATARDGGGVGGGVVGVRRREEKVAEMSRKGFLDLIASGGAGLKKGALEEA